LDNEGVSLTKTLETPVQVMQPGSLIAGKYTVIDEIGHGGMGVVYKAEDIKLKRCVALKFLPPHLMDSPELKERFLVEAQAAAALSHPNICVIHEVGESEDRPYIAMEYVEGETLRDRLRRGPLKTEEALDIAIQVAAGMGEAHNKGIIHRDIKSANIMITAKGQAKVMDFGLAKLRGGSSLTKSQTTLGTVAYMSPEQARGGDLDQKTDIWSLGVVLYEMIAGQLPFRGDHDQTVIYSILHHEPESLIRVRPGTAPELGQIVGQALTKKPADRYQTMEEFQEDLSAVAEGLKPLKARPARKIFGIKTAYAYSALAVVLALIFGLNVGGLRNRLIGGAGRGERVIKLAVLPFVDLSTASSSEPLADGISDALINALSRIPELRVIARTSAFLFKGQKVDVKEIGQKLNVRTILEGSVQVMGDRLRVGAQLINAEDGFQIWSEKYDREMADVFAIQDEIARLIVSTLKVEILGERETPLVKRPTENLEAYNLFLQGTSFASKLVKEDMFRAIGYFEKAVELDPKFALAYAALAGSYWALGNGIFVPPEEAYPKAKELVKKALAIDDKLEGAYLTLASIKRDYDWDFAGAENDYRKAIERNPGNAGAHGALAYLLSALGRHEEAVKEIKLDRELDPLQSRVWANVGLDLHWAGRNEEALEELKALLDFDPNHAGAYEYLGRVYITLGRYDDAIAHAAKAVDMEKRRPVFLIILAIAYARGGRIEESRAIVAELEERSKKEFVSPAVLAAAYGALGEKDRAFELIDKAYAMRDSRMVAFKSSPIFDTLRSDPRFDALLRKIGFGK
jgi:serine/threonine-protein kinase